MTTGTNRARCDVKLIPLSELGLMTVEEAARERGCDPSTVRRWASRGEIPVVQVGTGRSAKFLLRKTDLDAFTPRSAGAPEGNQNAKKEEPPKPAKKPRKR